MVILYVKEKKAAKLGSRAENCGEDMSGRLLSLDFLQSALFLIVFPVAMAVFGIIRTNLYCPSQILRALCLDVVLPGVFRVPIKPAIVLIDGKLRNFIHGVWGSRSACAVHADRRVMDFRRWSGSDQPNAQMFEDGPDNRRIFDAADDPHSALTSPPSRGQASGRPKDRLRISSESIAPSSAGRLFHFPAIPGYKERCRPCPPLSFSPVRRHCNNHST